jgi:TolA-binding protein
MSIKPERSEATESVNDQLKRLLSTYDESSKSLNELKNQMLKIQEQILKSQECVFKNFQVFSTTKEQYLMGVISAQKTQLGKMSHVLPNDPSIIKNLRDNNVDTQVYK